MRQFFALVVSLVIAWLVSSPIVEAQVNVFSGTCEAFGDFVRNHGAIDVFGVAHKRLCATWAPRPNFTITLSGPITSHTKRNGQICYSTMAHVQAALHPGTTVLTWMPSPPAANPAFCAATISAWKNEALEHENLHAHGYLDAANQINQKFANHPTAWCTFGKRLPLITVKAKLNAQAQDDAEEFAEPLVSASDELVDLHSCDPTSLCGACAPAPCPPGKLLINGKCYKQGCAFSTDYFVCGKDAHGYRIGCCPWPPGNTSVCADAQNMCPIPPK